MKDIERAVKRADDQALKRNVEDCYICQPVKDVNGLIIDNAVILESEPVNYRDCLGNITRLDGDLVTALLFKFFIRRLLYDPSTVDDGIICSDLA